jgi:hypothetical protein
MWQLSVFAYNISVMMRRKKNKKFYASGNTVHLQIGLLSFPQKITRSGHKSEIKNVRNTIFTRMDWIELDRIVFGSVEHVE